jgi:membrane fusion protein, multidrug efflux system
MKRFLHALLPVAILVGCVWLAQWLVLNAPKPRMVEVPPTLLEVEGVSLKLADHKVIVKSQGTVMPRTRSTLLPEVSGRVIELSPSFRPGGFFEKGDVLVTLDPVDYQTAVVVAEAAVAQAQAMMAEEQAKADQANENWKAMGRTGQPSALAQRSPQLAQAKASLAASEAEVLKAKRNLERTSIRAPYPGQVLEQVVDVGQYVTPGAQLGKIFAVDYVEIRLPLPEREMTFVDLPERFRDEAGQDIPATVLLRSTTSRGKPTTWNGKLVRVESALDTATRQIMAVAQVTDPYGKSSHDAPLKIGQFVEADIAGDVLKGVFVIPRSAVRPGNEIIIISTTNQLRRISIEPVLSTDKFMVVMPQPGRSPKPGDILCTTPIPFPADGAKVLPTVDGKKPVPSLAGSTAAKGAPVH